MPMRGVKKGSKRDRQYRHIKTSLCDMSKAELQRAVDARKR